MHPDRYQRLSELFALAADLQGEARRAFLDEQCPDEQMRRQVETLLADAEAHPDFMEAPSEAIEDFRRQLSVASFGEERFPDSIDGYRVIGVLGRGGMGTVLEAEQAHPNRRVALKVVHSGLVSAAALQRLQREAQILAILDHPGIAQIYSAGVVDLGYGQRPYYVMELVRGEPITSYVAHHGLDVRTRLELFVRVCDAVQHAHERGVIHRDLKPANILVTDAGRPKVLDFGVARAVSADAQVGTMQTETRQIVGTLPYMSPEQALGDRARLGPRSDVYSLGAILYELLTGQAPLNVKDRPVHEAILMIRDAEPTKLGSLDRSLRGDLEVVALTALAKEPEERYDSVAALAADARRLLAHEPIHARPPSTLYQLRKFARRNKALVGGVAATLVILVATLIVVTYQAASLAEAKRQADFEARRAAAVNEIITSAVRSAWRLGAGRDVSMHDYLRAVAAALDTNTLEPGVEMEVRLLIGQNLTVSQEIEEAYEHYRRAEELIDVAERVDPATIKQVRSGVRNLRELVEGETAGALAMREVLKQQSLVASVRGAGSEEDLQEAVRLAEKMYAEAQPIGFPLDPHELQVISDLAWLRLAQHRPDEALALFRRLHAAVQRHLGALLVSTGLESRPKEQYEAPVGLARTLILLGRYDEAEVWLRANERAMLRRLELAQAPDVIALESLRLTRSALVDLYESWQRPDYADRVRSLLQADARRALELPPLGVGIPAAELYYLRAPDLARALEEQREATQE